MSESPTGFIAIRPPKTTSETRKNRFAAIWRRKSKHKKSNLVRHEISDFEKEKQNNFILFFFSRSGPYKASRQLINMMIEELYIMSKFQNWTETGITGAENPTPLDEQAFKQFKKQQEDNQLHWIFLATRSGITAYWKLYHVANEEHIR